jgi:hypothetical protein
VAITRTGYDQSPVATGHSAIGQNVRYTASPVPDTSASEDPAALIAADAKASCERQTERPRGRRTPQIARHLQRFVRSRTPCQERVRNGLTAALPR